MSNVQDATNAATVADGALATTTDILQRIRSLAVEASSDTARNDDKQNLQTEVTQLLQEVNTDLGEHELQRLVAARRQPCRVPARSHGVHDDHLERVARCGDDECEDRHQQRPAGGFGRRRHELPEIDLGRTGYHDVGQGRNGTVDGTIELQVINTGTSIAVQETFVASNSAKYGSSVATKLLSANQAYTILDDVKITTGNFSSADVGVTSYIKVSQNVPAATTSAGAAFSFQSGADEGATIQMGLQATNASTLRLSNINLLISTSTGASIGAEDAIGQVDNALTTLLTERANLGSVTVRLQEDSSNDSIAATNLQASESNIRDLNVSAETTSYTADQILISVGTSVLQQSNNNAQSVERLFQ